MRRTARILSELHPVPKTAIWNWIKKFEEKLPISAEKKQRSLIALVVKARKKKYYVYSAVDVDKIYTMRNYPTTKCSVSCLCYYNHKY